MIKKKKKKEYLLLPLDEILVHHKIPSMKWLGILLLPPGWDASPSQDTQQYVAGTHLYTRVKRDNVEQSFLPKEANI